MMDGRYPYTSRLTGLTNYSTADQCRGVYPIRNLATLRVYIGATILPMFQRWAEHRRALDGRRHTCIALQEDWRRYGADLFEFEALDVVDDAPRLRSAEHGWIARYQAHGLALYNHPRKSGYPAEDIIGKSMHHALVCRVAAHRARRASAPPEEES